MSLNFRTLRRTGELAMVLLGITFYWFPTSLLLQLLSGAEVPMVEAQGLEYEAMWQGTDSFDEIMAKFMMVNEDNCAIMHVGDLKMPEDTVSHLPDIKEININPVFPNRTALLHLHNMALNRAFFFSYILQSR